MLKIELPIGALKAVALAAGDRDIRYYLNGVLLDQAKEGLFLVATDGHRMHVMRVRQDVCLPMGAQVIIPADVVGRIKTHRNVLSVTVEIRDDLSGGDLIVPEARLPWPAVEGRFPDWRRVLPRSVSLEGAGASINPSYLSDVSKAAAFLGNKKGQACVPQLAFSGRTGNIRALLVGQPEFIAVITPIVVRHQGGFVDFDVPSWAI